jgi:hypothetical protein
MIVSNVRRIPVEWKWIDVPYFISFITSTALDMPVRWIRMHEAAFIFILAYLCTYIMPDH